MKKAFKNTTLFTLVLVLLFSLCLPSVALAEETLPEQPEVIEEWIEDDVIQEENEPESLEEEPEILDEEDESEPLSEEEPEVIAPVAETLEAAEPMAETAEPLAYDKSEYSENDMNVLNNIIANNVDPSASNPYASILKKDDPASWGARITWSDTLPRRITSMVISDSQLKGTLNLTGLTELTFLNCGTNNLTGLNLTGLTKLTNLRCYENQLTTLNLAGLTSLNILTCDNNKLTSIELSPTLAYIYCGNNQLTTLNVTGLTNLSSLSCARNYFPNENAIIGLNKQQLGYLGFDPQYAATTKAHLTYSLTAKTYNGKAQGVSVTPKSGVGKVTAVYYNGSKTVPKNAGTYAVTVDVATGTDYIAASKISLGNYKINKASLSKVKVTVADTAYTGKQSKPSKVTFNGVSLKTSAISSKTTYGKNKSIGKGTMKITGKGNFTGTKTISFKIVPKSNKVSKISVGKKQMKVTWSKVSAAQKITKYQVRYRVAGTSKWTTKTYDDSKASATIKSLKKGKKYEVQIRSYKTVSKVKYYSAWSAVKTSGKIKLAETAP